MKFLFAVALCAFAAQSAFAQEMFEDSALEQNEARFLYFNTSSTATSLTLLGALILLGVIAYLIYAGGLLGASSGYNRNGYQGEYYEDPAQQYAQYRSNDAAPEFNMAKIVEWMAIFRDMYENMDVNDIECQKRLICDIVQNESYFGAGATNLKKGFRAARFLEYVSLPDDIRELADEYLDANSRAEKNQDCAQYFQCPFSLKDSAHNNLL